MMVRVGKAKEEMSFSPDGSVLPSTVDFCRHDDMGIIKTSIPKTLTAGLSSTARVLRMRLTPYYSDGYAFNIWGKFAQKGDNNK